MGSTNANRELSLFGWSDRQCEVAPFHWKNMSLSSRIYWFLISRCPLKRTAFQAKTFALQDSQIWRSEHTSCLISTHIFPHLKTSLLNYCFVITLLWIIIIIITTTTTDTEASNKWLTNADLFAEAEGFLTAIQDQVTLTRNYKKYILNQPDTDELCRRCGKESETVQHIPPSCEQLAPTECVKRHDGLAKIIHQKLAEAAKLI